MTQLIVHKDKLHDMLLRFLSSIQTDKIHLEFDEKYFLAQPVQEKSVLEDK